MAKISFESLPAYGFVGGTLTGTMRVELDRAIDANRVTMALHGDEIAQIAVHEGKNSRVVKETRRFLELSVLPSTLGQLGPGEARFPFSFTVPPEAIPSFASRPLPSTRGRLFIRPDGCYVEYELEGRIDVPWWMDPVDREVVPVYSTRRILGAFPQIEVPPDGRRPSLSVTADAPTVVPGQSVVGSYRIQNPGGEHLRSVTIGVQRFAAYAAYGTPGHSFGPHYAVTIPLDTTEPVRAGRFELPVPNAADSTGPSQGALFQTYWNVTAQIDVQLGFDVQFSAPMPPA
ncbi:MAG: hypothetical protein L3K06_01615 [Thermoplasmata archaeon]|nr:hypothetical protein [Thermoplasmata archaeon]MCI4354045.1 hypothetical protein [Thermoplasmata archaeon]